jgi:hypothetical protein
MLAVKLAFSTLPRLPTLKPNGSIQQSWSYGLYLDTNEVYFRVANVFHRVRRQRVCPDYGRCFICRTGIARIKEQVAIVITSNEIACTPNLYNAGPFMRVDGHNLPRPNAHIQNADMFIFE